MRSLLFTLVIALGLPLTAWPSPARYAVALSPAPVLNTPDFARFFSGDIKLDPCRGVRPIEFIALTGTLFRIEGEESRDGVTVYRVSTNDYPYESRPGYFVDSRFVREVAAGHEERARRLPPLAKVQEALRGALDKPYVWGGNVKEGVPLLRKYYPFADPLAGVDCSGLLYQATDGYTPRNTSTLTAFGSAVKVAGLTVDQIAERLEPLDLIVWNGHVMIVMDKKTIIQSTMGCSGGGGVHASPLRDALSGLMRSRKPLDRWVAEGSEKKGFVVRRWFPR